MAAAISTQQMRFATVSRTLVAIAADVFTEVQKTVVGPANVRTARDNAWAAIQADRARHAARAETARAVAAMLAASAAMTAAAHGSASPATHAPQHAPAHPKPLATATR